MTFEFEFGALLERAPGPNINQSRFKPCLSLALPRVLDHDL
jgi:hypothetical protein